MKKAFLLGKLKNTNDEKKIPLWERIKVINKSGTNNGATQFI